MSEKSKRDEKQIEDGLRQWHDENQERADRLSGRIIDGSFVEHPAVQSQDDIDQATMRENEARIDRGENVTPEMYRQADAIYHRHKPR